MRRLTAPHRPTGLERLAFRMPILLYRVHLGWLLGGRFMLINHIGRTTGEVHRVVVEVVEHDAPTDSYVAASGFGPRSDWYLNLRAHPQVTIQVGRRVLGVDSVPLTPEEGGELMARYAVRHGVAARKLCRFMGFEVDGSAEDYRAVGRELPFIRFVPRRVAA
ncbi:MAG: nitroreductase family deazaflavin-dependent oxidoreductase [Gaiellaceae bacterium]